MEELNPVLLIPENDIFEQDMEEIFRDFEELATVQLLMRGRYAIVRDQ